MGRGTYNGLTSPAELIISGSRSGLHFPYAGQVYRVQNDIEYYAKDPNCDYKWVSSEDGNTVAKAIKFSRRVSNTPYTFYVGRIFVQQGFHVGKVRLERGVIYYGYQGKEHSSSTYQVLICDKIPSIKSTTPATTPTPATTTTPAEVSSDSDDLLLLMKYQKAEITELKEELKDLKAMLMSKVQELKQCKANAIDLRFS